LIASGGVSPAYVLLGYIVVVAAIVASGYLVYRRQSRRGTPGQQ